MKRFIHFFIGLAVLGTAQSTMAMPLGLRMALWNRSARAAVRMYPLGEALGADERSASLPWASGIDGSGTVNGYDDATAAGGRSVKLMASDDSSAWVEVAVTNACRVTFRWKCSCEPKLKGRVYDYFFFACDGEQGDLICGETDWTERTFQVAGDGEHRLCWMFVRDEDGSSGGDCAWLANVAVVPSVTLTFSGGGATEGTAPASITAYADESVVLPGCGSLAWPDHHFVGWSDGENVYDAETECVIGEINAGLVAVWEEDEPQTFGEYLNWGSQTFTVGGDAEWFRVKGVSADGYALRSGEITDSQTSRIDTVVAGPGSIRFMCKVDGEIVKRTVYDGLAFCIDGVQQGDLIGDSAWTEKTFEVFGEGPHTLSWLYVKDEEGDGGGEDCAWLDNVVWTPSGSSEFSAGDAVVDGAVTLTAAQATWLNGLGDYETIRTLVAAMDAEAFEEAYLLNLDVTNAGRGYTFEVTSCDASGENVVVTVRLVRTGAVKKGVADAPINGVLRLAGSMTLLEGGFAPIAEATVSDENFANGDTATLSLPKVGAVRFFRPTITE